MSVSSSSLTVILDSNTGVTELNYPIPDDTILSLTNVMITFGSGGSGAVENSGVAGSIIYLDLGELTSHTSLNGNLVNNQVLVLTNNITTGVTNYNPSIFVGLDRGVPVRFNYKVTQPDGTLIANLSTITLQFSYVLAQK